MRELLIGKNTSIRDAMKLIDKTGKKVLFAVDDRKKLLGSLTDGDIRRWILSGESIIDKVSNIYNKSPITLRENYDIEEVKKLMIKKKIQQVPVLDSRNVVVDILLWRDVFGRNIKVRKNKVDIPVVIMAGGKGSRLAPFTKVLPKALIPIGEKPIIEIIIDKFSEFGIRKFYISLNYKSRMIKSYFDDVNSKINIRYITENKPLGTAGALRFLENKMNGPFIVTNCDILIESDYLQIYNFHKKSSNDITIVTSCRHFVVPYGICEIRKGGDLKHILEKPEYNFWVNTGMYLLNPEIVKLIPKNKFSLMTDLIEKVKKKKGKIGVFPISEKSWTDIGQLEDYKNTIRDLEARL